MEVNKIVMLSVLKLNINVSYYGGTGIIHNVKTFIK